MYNKPLSWELKSVFNQVLLRHCSEDDVNISHRNISVIFLQSKHLLPLIHDPLEWLRLLQQDYQDPQTEAHHRDTFACPLYMSKISASQRNSLVSSFVTINLSENPVGIISFFLLRLKIANL